MSKEKRKLEKIIPSNTDQIPCGTSSAVRLARRDSMNNLYPFGSQRIIHFLLADGSSGLVGLGYFK